MSIIRKIALNLTAIRYNLKIIFANKFVIFLVAAVIFYLVIIGIMLFSNSGQTAEDIFNTLIFPGILIMFYPVIFNIQNDKDSRMLEIIFGVPNYRYKVYLFRFGITLLLLYVLMLLMAWFAVFAVVKIQVFSLVYKLMYPLFFLACSSFFFATITRNGNATAVIMVIIGLFFLFFQEPLEHSKWNLFLNPYNMPGDMNHTIFIRIVRQNRLIYMIGSIIGLLWGLINLQRREKFV